MLISVRGYDIVQNSVLATFVFKKCISFLLCNDLIYIFHFVRHV